MNWYKIAAMSTSEAYDILGVSPGIDPNMFKQTLKRKRKELHPDVSDDPEALLKFQLMEQAAKIILNDIQGYDTTKDVPYSSATFMFSDFQLDRAWHKILENSGDIVSQIFSASIDKSQINNKIKTNDGMVYLDWNALFEDYNFAGFFDFISDRSTRSQTFNEVLLSQNGQIVASVYIGGVFEEIENEPLIDAINNFYSLIMKYDEDNRLSVDDRRTLEELVGGDFELYLLDNYLFDTFLPRNQSDSVHFLLITYAPLKLLPKSWKEWGGNSRFYIIPENMSLAQFKSIFEAAQRLNIQEAFDYLIANNIYISQDIYDITAEDAYEWIKGWEEYLKQTDFNEYETLEAWYRKMSYIQKSDNKTPIRSK